MKIISSFSKTITKALSIISALSIKFAKSYEKCPPHSLILFPVHSARLCCGLCALIAYKGRPQEKKWADLDALEQRIAALKDFQVNQFISDSPREWDHYLGGQKLLSELLEKSRHLKNQDPFFEIFSDSLKQERLQKFISTLESMILKETDAVKTLLAGQSANVIDLVVHRIDMLQDAAWCMKKEVLDTIHKSDQLDMNQTHRENIEEIVIFKRINAVLSSIDRLEVRGRDSAGISVMFTLPDPEFENFRQMIQKHGLWEQLKHRTNRKILVNNSINIHTSLNQENISSSSISFVYKTAAEIGALGDNIQFIRNQIKNDQILHLVTRFAHTFNTVLAHTRWASVGAITEANCHPVDNEPTDTQMAKNGIIHVSLNGDIDNYIDLKNDYEERYDTIHPEITTDTKIIPLQIEHYLRQGNPLVESFRLAVNDFQGSHAISMHTSLAPGKLFLAQRGSGQAIFVGIGQDHYIAASEVYGLVEETQHYIKLNGEINGQILILDQSCKGGLSGIETFSYEGETIELDISDIQTTQITSRDIDRQEFPHYFLKEISEAPASVEKTLLNKYKTDRNSGTYSTQLDRSVIPEFLQNELREKKIRKIFFIGQGTAGIAAQGCAHILNVYLADTDIEIRAKKSSELSGFSIPGDGTDPSSMEAYLIVAISQSGTTTDTNRTVDMVRARGARTLAIVNRRDSDLTFKTDGVLYTSSGRDIEMSVASTKAFYSQIAAGTILGLHLAHMMEVMTLEQVTIEINELISLPDKMRTILSMGDSIRDCARKFAVGKNYWATVGSGSNKTSADEIRIKLSELCYKTISSDYVEDKKHIDLSSEPLIIVCAAGTRENVLGDIIKDTAIFNAHKATPLVIANEGEDRFDPYAAQIFRIPKTSEHLSPVLNTLVGHIWGYYAALAMNDGSKFMYDFKLEIQDLLEVYTAMGHDIYEVILEKKFREKIAEFYHAFSIKRSKNQFPAALGLDTVSNLTLLLKYLAGRLPVSDFEADFGRKGTPANMMDALFETLGESINTMARPVDAIKHQAKTVTVGTSRVSQQFKGVLFDELAAHNIMIGQVTNKNVLVLRNLQNIISQVKGALLYRISGLTMLGELSNDTRIEVIKKTGNLINEFSRVEKDQRLKGTKNIIVREGNVYIGKGRKDSRSILVIPVLTASGGTTNKIEYLLSLHVGFKSSDQVTLLKKIKALGGKYTRIKDLLLETGDYVWDDKLLDQVEIKDLFGDSAEKIAEYLISLKA